MDEIMKSLNRLADSTLANPRVQESITYISELSPEAKLAIMGGLVLLLILVLFRSKDSEDMMSEQHVSLLQRRIDHQDVTINDTKAKLNDRIAKLEQELRSAQIEGELRTDSVSEQKAVG